MLGVTFISFLLMVHSGPDQTFELLGKNPSAAQIAEIRQALGYDDPLLRRYAAYLHGLATLDLGLSNTTGERVGGLISRTVPVTLALVLPGFVLGNLFGLLLGMFAAVRSGTWVDRAITGLSVLGMSISFLVVIIGLQVLLCTPYGLNLFPARGWEVSDFGSYLRHVFVPTLSIMFITIGYNTRFYRAVIAEELSRDHVRTARAYGAGTGHILFASALRNGSVAIMTRLMYSLPLIVVSGSLLIETYFGIPGVGKATFDAISSGDQPVLKAVVGLTAVAFVMLQTLTDIVYRWLDPRVVIR